MYNHGATVPGNVYEEERPPPPPYNPNPTCPPYDFVEQQQTNQPYNQHAKPRGTSSGAPHSTGPPPGSVLYQSAESNPKDGSADTGRVVIVTQEAPKNPAVPVQQSFTMHYVLSCLAFWLCGFLFGGIAFGLAVFAKRKAEEGDRENAKQFSIASLALSVVGFVTGCILWGFIIYYIVETCLTDDSCNYKCEGTCYNHKESVLEDDCYEHGQKVCVEGGYCFYNGN